MTEDSLHLLVKELTRENDLLRKRCLQNEEAYELLKSQFLNFRRHRFGQSSERYVDLQDPQISLYDTAATDQAQLEEDIPVVESTDNVVDIKSKRHQKKAKQSFADHLPRKEVIIPVKEHHKTCLCGCRKKVIKYERHERLHYVPPIFEVIVEKREVVACPKGCAGEMFTAAKPKHILPKSKISESVLAHIIVSKLDDRQPYYHLEKQFESRCGFSFPRQSMARASIKVASPLQPMFNLMKDQVIDYDIGALDATTLQVLKEPGRPATRKSYVYCFRGGEPGKEAILYEYNAFEHKHFVDNWFSGFEGTLHCDADPFFNLMFSRDEIEASYCITHTRRYFEKIAKLTKGKGLARQAMGFYNKIYKIETQAKDQHMTPDQRLEHRRQYSKPIMEELKQWLDDHHPTVAPKTLLGKAFNYSLKFWDGLNRFLEDGRLEVDNNLTEQQIKPFVIARKNFMFCDSVDGAKALCLHYSLIRTAKHHGLDPYHYYVKILQDIPHCQTVEDFEVLLPWNIDLAKVGSTKMAA